ncbi:uncharacterized protein [Symphalangus syndactylus]|uniref:uncharacterized protein n=1 Tax=Symphalangus syndactylus TaxID=9590 RepID=UPI0030061833
MMWNCCKRDDRLLFSPQCKSEIEINEARLEQCHGKGVWLIECLWKFGELGAGDVIVVHNCSWFGLSSVVTNTRQIEISKINTKVTTTTGKVLGEHSKKRTDIVLVANHKAHGFAVLLIGFSLCPQMPIFVYHVIFLLTHLLPSER